MMETEKIIATLHHLERKVLPILKETDSFDEIADRTKLQKVEVMRALQWLQNKKLIRINQKLQEKISLDKYGIKYRANGLPERSFLGEIRRHPSLLSAIEKKTHLSRQEINISLGVLKSKKAIEIKKDNELIISITDIGIKMHDEPYPEQEFLKKKFPLYKSDTSPEEMRAYEGLKKRKGILKFNIVKIIRSELTQAGSKVLEHKIKENGIIDRLTPGVLKSGEWKNKRLRSYDVKINVPNVSGGKVHSVSQAIQYIKRIWLDLGFKEMNGNFVETSFWTFDALFSAQDHPVRDLQDTFYIREPSMGKLPKNLVKNVKATHENGWTTGSKGWNYSWSEKNARENVLRTHTTNLSARTLAKLKKSDLPAKFFSVGKVFRNETLSWKSLFEFIQVEGIVVDPDANFMNLKGYLKEFFAKMGFPDVRIRPAHFPYTEPSAEVDVWHPVKKQWVELGGSGLFRPEVVKPLLGFECPVLAWGLGMERTIMEYYDIKDVRDVYKNDIKQLREMKLWMK